MLAIETRNLTKCYGSLMAVDSINLEIPSGALFVLIGPNGAGKTTTIRMLAGLLEPSSGEILLDGAVTNADAPEFRRQIGYMPDFFGVYEDMLVWEYLDFFARCYDLPSARRDQVTTELLELVDPAPKRDDYVEDLSRGMRQRLCLAHALVHDPQILLLDEPASGLDPRARVEMRELLQALGAMGKTVIVSSHILAELDELCDSIGIIELGKLVASGPIEMISRQTRGGRLLQVRTLSARPDVQAFFTNHPEVSNIYEHEDRLEVEFRGNDEAVAGLLKQVVEAGIQVIAFSEISNDLEDVFLKLTEGHST